ncbi:hypothetical protein [Thermofilum pendens]|uniref:Uncharacterized protein n=1 Tax=Thermofilum pendens (strain DSM 2475 / Hrk 5) TaxID=368408 RepID=A1S1D4_THEPD|nr:hypothetical protein [Thermofilum pendens]ABL79264.1 hypothetical protein Tpen_1869 [Thermofilum pendens Hrk 5]
MEAEDFLAVAFVLALATALALGLFTEGVKAVSPAWAGGSSGGGGGGSQVSLGVVELEVEGYAPRSAIPPGVLLSAKPLNVVNATCRCPEDPETFKGGVKCICWVTVKEGCYPLYPTLCARTNVVCTGKKYRVWWVSGGWVIPTTGG